MKVFTNTILLKFSVGYDKCQSVQLAYPLLFSDIHSSLPPFFSLFFIFNFSISIVCQYSELTVIISEILIAIFKLGLETDYILNSIFKKYKFWSFYKKTAKKKKKNGNKKIYLLILVQKFFLYRTYSFILYE